MLISEIYYSRQGEGVLTGTPSLFIRTSGCNLRCGFCDTPFTSWNPEGVSLNVAEILAKANSIDEPVRHVVITGGEPMMVRQIDELCEKLSAAGMHITIETAGTIFRQLKCDLMSISPKLSNSDPGPDRAGGWLKKHQQARHRPEIVQQLMQQYDYQLKFVVDQANDIDEIVDYVELVQPLNQSRVMLMPQGVELSELEAKSEWLISLCDEHGFSFCPRRHIEWYGNLRRT